LRELLSWSVATRDALWLKQSALFAGRNQRDDNSLHRLALTMTRPIDQL
jgi:hypothetical protein